LSAIEKQREERGKAINNRKKTLNKQNMQQEPLYISCKLSFTSSSP